MNTTTPRRTVSATATASKASAARQAGDVGWRWTHLTADAASELDALPAELQPLRVGFGTLPRKFHEPGSGEPATPDQSQQSRDAGDEADAAVLALALAAKTAKRSRGK